LGFGGKTRENKTLKPRDNYEAVSGITVEADKLFDRNWWMLKKD